MQRKTGEILKCLTFITTAMTFVFATIGGISNYWILDHKNSHAGLWIDCRINNSKQICEYISNSHGESLQLPLWLWMSRLSIIYACVFPLGALMLMGLIIIDWIAASYKVVVGVYTGASIIFLATSLIVYVSSFELYSHTIWLENTVNLPITYGWSIYCCIAASVSGIISILFAIFADKKWD